MPTETCTNCHQVFKFVRADLQLLTGLDEAIVAKHRMDQNRVRLTCPKCHTVMLISPPPELQFQQLFYGGERYQLFANVEDFVAEVERNKKAALTTDFGAIGAQMRELFVAMNQRFGAESRELLAVAQSNLFCRKCGAHWASWVMTLLIMGYGKTNRPVPTECAKCKSTDLLVIYRASEPRPET